MDIPPYPRLSVDISVYTNGDPHPSPQALITAILREGRVDDIATASRFYGREAVDTVFLAMTEADWLLGVPPDRRPVATLIHNRAAFILDQLARDS